MPFFRCDECGCIENTACADYWLRKYEQTKLLCSECDPNIKKWHGLFLKISAKGMYLGNDGFIYYPEEVEGVDLDWRKENAGFEVVKQIGG